MASHDGHSLGPHWKGGSSVLGFSRRTFPKSTNKEKITERRIAGSMQR